MPESVLALAVDDVPVDDVVVVEPLVLLLLVLHAASEKDAAPKARAAFRQGHRFPT